MSKVQLLLAQRLKTANDSSSKVKELAEISSDGNLSSFSGVFRVSPLKLEQQESLQQLLEQYALQTESLGSDLRLLSSLTCEVRAIHNQAAILHGQRIKKAQQILKNYREGAFTAWLLFSYGNRQTPYNFLQYYELFSSLPALLATRLEEMPRQVAYALASRKAELDAKMEMISAYQGQSKQEFLSLIRLKFPLPEKDRRVTDSCDSILSSLKKLKEQCESPLFKPNAEQKKCLQQLLSELLQAIQ
jgi:hypothetical protein